MCNNIWRVESEIPSKNISLLFRDQSILLELLFLFSVLKFVIYVGAYRSSETSSALTFAMAETIKLFRSVRQIYQEMGIYPTQSNQTAAPYARYLFNLLSMIIFSISSSAFFLFEATAIQEFGITFYAACAGLTMSAALVIKSSKMLKIVKLFEKMEEFIAKSESIILIFSFYCYENCVFFYNT